MLGLSAEGKGCGPRGGSFQVSRGIQSAGRNGSFPQGDLGTDRMCNVNADPLHPNAHLSL